jgi:plastocyanin
MKQVGLGLFALAGLSGLLLAPGLAPAQVGPPKAPTTYTVEIRHHQFLVNGKAVPLRIKGGDRVVWVNKDVTTHTATSDRGAPFKFDTKLLAPGAKSKVVTFSAGDYTVDYHCEIHRDMRSSVVVGTGGATDSGLSDSGLVPNSRPGALLRRQPRR